MLSLAGRTCHGQRTTGVRISVGVPIEIELHTREPGTGLEVAGKVSIRKRLEQSRRFRTVGFGLLGGPRHRVCECEHGKGRRGQRRVTQQPRRVHRALGRLVHRREPGPEELVHDELDHDRDCLGRFLVGQVFEGARKAAASLLLKSEEALNRGTGAGELGAHCVRVVRQDRERVHQGIVAVREATDRGQGLGAGEEELDALLRRSGLRQQAQRVREPVCRACRCEPDGFRAGLPQDGGGGGVAFAG